MALQGGLRPHNFCLPILKREEHRQAVLTAAVSGNPRFFLGTDSAPHAIGDKVYFDSERPFILLLGPSNSYGIHLIAVQDPVTVSLKSSYVILG